MQQPGKSQGLQHHPTLLNTTLLHESLIAIKLCLTPFHILRHSSELFNIIEQGPKRIFAKLNDVKWNCWAVLPGPKTGCSPLAGGKFQRAISADVTLYIFNSLRKLLNQENVSHLEKAEEKFQRKRLEIVSNDFFKSFGIYRRLGCHPAICLYSVNIERILFAFATSTIHNRYQFSSSIYLLDYIYQIFR